MSSLRLTLLPLLSRPGPERPRVGPSGDEELPERDARVQIWHERQDCHRQAGQGRNNGGHREEVSEASSRRQNVYIKSTILLKARLKIIWIICKFRFFKNVTFLSLNMYIHC